MLFTTNAKTAQAGKLLSEPTEHAALFDRVEGEFENNSGRFKLKKREFQRQYAHLYTERLLTCRPKLEEAVKLKWGKLKC